VARSLASGVPLVACPAAGDMGENSSRVAWAGVGVPLPRRLVSARGVRLGVQRVLSNAEFRSRAQALGEWSRRHDGAVVAAETLESFVS
jgi:UDP:flavonoid glycosyltransferase YjiC (YdhE family)